MLTKSNIKIMTLGEYKRIKMGTATVLGIVFSQAIIYHNWFVPIIFAVASSLLLLYLRSKVKEIIADERDYAVGGRAAFLAMQIYSWLAVVVMMIFYALRDTNPVYEAIGVTLAVSACFLMFTYAVIFHYYDRISFSNKKFMYSVFILILFLGLFAASVRIFSGEDGWICQDGQWVKHGNPAFPAPNVKCE